MASDTKPDPSRLLDDEGAELLIEGILAVVGPGRFLFCGLGAEAICHRLVRRGIDAVHSERIPACGPDSDWAHFDVIVLWHSLDKLELPTCAAELERLRPLAKRAVLVRTDSRGRPTRQFGDHWLEQSALEAGYRKHPLHLQLNSYESREVAGSEDLLLLEPIPPAVLARFPLADLAAERDLHMDMLREAGRRADAHVERYRLALQFVRPGDTVVDVACGLGYGSRILFLGSGAARVVGVDESETAVRYAQGCYGTEGQVEFVQGDAGNLAFLLDNSVDLLVSFETLEHLLEPERLLEEARRTLRPGGRIVACVPNRWVDETGNDPNPHHHHVYSWDRLRNEISSRFRLEKAFRQIAGGGMTHTHSPRLLREFDPAGEPGDAEWLIVVAMRDPVEGRPVPYVESTFTGYESVKGFHVARFDQDYANPWLVKAMVSIGFRFLRIDGLLDMARQVVLKAEEGSADQGAALCVEAYALLEASDRPPAERQRVRKALEAYVEQAGTRPHELRWAVSNLYALGLLHMADREFESAARCFKRCAVVDPTPFSPLLATKTIGAAYLGGLLCALSGDIGDARRLWIRGVKSAKKLFSGSWTNVIGRDDRPLYFGLPEVAHAISRASKCAYALSALPDLELRPGRFWVEVSRDMEAVAARDSLNLRLMSRRLSEADKRSSGSDAPQSAAMAELQYALGRQTIIIKEMHQAFGEQAANIASLQEQLNSRDRAIAEQAEFIATQYAAFEQQARNIAELRDSLNERDDAFTRQEATIAGQIRSFSEQAANIADLREQLNSRDRALAEQSAALARQREFSEQQALEIARLSARRAEVEDKNGAQASIIASLEEAVAEARNEATTLRDRNAAQASVIASLEEAAAEARKEATTLRDRILAGEREVAALNEGIANLRAEHEALERRFATLVAENASLTERLVASDSARERLEASLREIRGSWPYRILRRWMGSDDR